MAATLTFKSYGPPVFGGFPVSEVSGTISIGDVGFLNISNPDAPAVVTVTPDKVRTRLVTQAMSETATGTVVPGVYENVGGATYRLVSQLFP